MADAFPEVYSQFEKIANTLENHYKDMQDMEFTVEDRKLYMLQTRNGKRTAAAAVKVAVDLVKEGLIDEETAVMRIEPDQIDQLLHPVFDKEELEKAEAVAKGLPASPGAATGQIAFSADDAAEMAAEGKKVILVREETSPEDLAGMVAAEGILTARGGMTSHAAVVARGMGKCCVAGCKEISVDEANKKMIIGDKVYGEGDSISLNGSDGSVYAESIKTLDAELSGDFGQIMEWADDYRTLKVRTNADNPRDAEQGVKFGAEGIGLCRTEHMFFDDERIPKIRRMILADNEDERRAALAELLPYQKEDFKGIYKAMGDRPVTIRLLDPPLHEFLPKTDEDIKQLSEQFGIPYEKIVNKTLELHEFNPMLGHRGCRLAITYPEIAEMQTEAIIRAALEVHEEEGIDILPEIMVPLVGHVNELTYVKKSINEVADRLIAEAGSDMKYMVGTMIEVPRAAMTADKIAEEAEFFSFGTNDLTQMGFGLSRDDTGAIIKEYEEKGILDGDPFQTLDQDGIGKLVRMAVEGGRKTRQNIKLGICGEHGGDPETVKFCHAVGLNYVSCSPFRVPIARLAAAQASIVDKTSK
ncbi:MAG: pyruvate, phosphate dikinase, partial [Mogibacterium sp.]|nr:pyruvate, phosphate dikinase [Mogibacterium sp.]